MPTYDVTLAGYNSSTSDTDHLVKWVNAPNLEAVLLFAKHLPLHGQPYDMVTLRPYGFADGVDVEIDEDGHVIAAHPTIEGLDIRAIWIDQSAEATLEALRRLRYLQRKAEAQAGHYTPSEEEEPHDGT